MIDGKYPELLFEKDDDVWDIINRLVEETKGVNADLNKNFNISKSLEKQLPFFACKNIILSKEHQKDIARYIYCTKFKTSPYSGSYSQQPLRWIKKSFIIRSVMGSMTSSINKEDNDG